MNSQITDRSEIKTDANNNQSKPVTGHQKAINQLCQERYINEMLLTKLKLCVANRYDLCNYKFCHQGFIHT